MRKKKFSGLNMILINLYNSFFVLNILICKLLIIKKRIKKLEFDIFYITKSIKHFCLLYIAKQFFNDIIYT